MPAFLVVGDTDEERDSLARDGPHAGGLLRVDAQLRVHLRAARPRGHDRPASANASGPATSPGMAAEIDDDLLENFITEGTWDDIADKIVAKYGGIATRVVSYFTGSDVVRDPDTFERWGVLARKVIAGS